MYQHKIFWFLTILIGFILQITLSDSISIFGTSPNFLLLGTIFFAIQCGPIVGEWTGFIWGLLSDIASVSIFGSQTFVFTLIGYCAGCLQGKINEEKTAAQMSLVFLMSLFYILGFLVLENLFTGSLQRFKVGILFLQPLYTTLFCPVVFFLLLRWYSWFHKGDHTGAIV